MDSPVVDYVPNSSWDGTLKETCGLRYKDVIAMKFDSMEDAWAFYHGYSRAVRFGVRLSNIIQDSEDRIFSRVWVYENKGFRDKKYMCNTNSKRMPKLQTRVVFKACFSVALDRDMNKFSTYEKVRLANIFWWESHTLVEYQCFEDVLVFNNTYKTNAYAMPLVLFVGVNNHCVTCVFGVALLSDETMQSYRWVLNTLMESVGHKYLIYILTDRDEAMRQAINEIFPNSWHKICGWHVAKNAFTHFHTEEKKSTFRSLLFKQLTEDEFKELWNKMLEQHGLEENDWMSRIVNPSVSSVLASDTHPTFSSVFPSGCPLTISSHPNSPSSGGVDLPIENQQACLHNLPANSSPNPNKKELETLVPNDQNLIEPKQEEIQDIVGEDQKHDVQKLIKTSVTEPLSDDIESNILIFMSVRADVDGPVFKEKEDTLGFLTSESIASVVEKINGSGPSSDQVDSDSVKRLKKTDAVDDQKLKEDKSTSPAKVEEKININGPSSEVDGDGVERSKQNDATDDGKLKENESSSPTKVRVKKNESEPSSKVDGDGVERSKQTNMADDEKLKEDKSSSPTKVMEKINGNRPSSEVDGDSVERSKQTDTADNKKLNEDESSSPAKVA
ncbi:hypothetical protein Dsin_019085 [Dipteronia sinensis]|uniref:MULE transposase domain-containing protein n=1 Tax=Dipteronia sinensis TaxID=43782 RepID=A0AAE0A7D7_9ROSI|nr:hypothetical protein Dsin_019085 [Dipteronia sinensis]